MTDTNKHLDNDFPEAPASVTYSIVSRDGYPALFTIRDSTVLGLIQKMSIMEDKLKALLYTPQVKQSFGAKKEVEYVKDASGNPMPCPTCKVGKIKVIHSPKGTFYGCDQSKFNPTTKSYDGCKYFSTVDPNKVKDEVEIPEDF